MTNEVEATIRMAKGSLSAAEIMLEHGFSRDAANRSYAAMEHAARAMLLAENQRLRKHQEVIGSFGRLFAKPRRVDAKFHRYLIDDFELRNIAEYDPLPEPPVTIERATTVLNHAKEFVAMAENFLKTHG